jgi:hypothetical protein
MLNGYYNTIINRTFVLMSPFMELACRISCTSVVGCCDETDYKVLNIRISKVRTMSCDRTGDDDEGERKVSDDK